MRPTLIPYFHFTSTRESYETRSAYVEDHLVGNATVHAEKKRILRGSLSHHLLPHRSSIVNKRGRPRDKIELISSRSINALWLLPRGGTFQGRSIPTHSLARCLARPTDSPLISFLSPSTRPIVPHVRLRTEFRASFIALTLSSCSPQTPHSPPQLYSEV